MRRYTGEMEKRREYKVDWPKILMVVLCFIGVNGNAMAQDYRKVVDLNGSWRFSIGDDEKWAAADYNDSSWERIQVPSQWENQGFHGYDGFAWYRTNFNFPSSVKAQSLFLKLGTIDDVDEVFVNGKKVGRTGSFPPRFSTAYNSNRVYHVPVGYLKENNIIAVRVYDDIGEGGIVHGDISLVVDRDAIPLDVDLQGAWKFKTGRNAHKDLGSVAEWDDILVPGHWENQGYKNYDGYACYVLDFAVNENILEDRMVLVLGKIDDLDQVYVNDVLVGQSGAFKPSTVEMYDQSYRQLRGYYLPPNLIKANQETRIVVRVYDAIEGGGIYTGSVGLITQENYINYWNSRRRR